MAKRKAVEVKAELKELRDKYEAVISRDDPSDDAELSEMNGQISALVAEFSARAQDEALVDSNRDAMRAIFSPQEQQPTSDGSPKAPAITGLSQKILGDASFKAWMDQLTAGGTKPISKGVRLHSPTVNLSGPEYGATLLTGLSSTSAGAFVVNDRTNIIVPAVRADLRAVDLLTRLTTESDTVEYVRIGTETNAAAPTLEATTTSNGAKPESSSAMSVVTAIVETIPHWIPVTKRAMADARQLAGYIDNFLRWGILAAINDQVVNGDGNTPNLVGIDDLSGKQTQAWSNDILETTRKARTKVRVGTGGATPTGYLMNPTEWETIDLLQDNENRYYFGGPSQVGTPMLWGLPVVEDEAVTAGLGFVGDWRMGVIWDREQTSITMTDSHSDFFIRNLLAILAEARLTIGWLRPAAFVEMDLTA